MFDYENEKNCRFYLRKVSNGQCIFASETTLELKRPSLFILINTFFYVIFSCLIVLALKIKMVIRLILTSI